MIADETKGSGRVAGGVLVVAAVLTLGAMLHHPHDAAGGSMARMAQVSRIVHGALIGLMVVELYCVATFARLRGLGRPLVLAGLTFFAVGTIAMLPAPILNGFVQADLLANGQQAPDETLFVVATAFAKLASVLMSVGIVLFSIGLMHDRGAKFWFGLVSVVTVLPVPIALLAGALQLDFHGMLMVIVAWSLWYAGLGILMLRGAN